MTLLELILEKSNWRKFIFPSTLGQKACGMNLKMEALREDFRSISQTASYSTPWLIIKCSRLSNVLSTEHSPP